MARMVVAIFPRSLRAGMSTLMSGCPIGYFPHPQQAMPAIAVMEVIAVVAVVATTETMPTIAVQHGHGHGAPW
jgi:hypothetical protein